LKAPFALRPTNGLIGGLTVQFAEGRWPDQIGPGLAMTEEAFIHLVEPHLPEIAPGWTPMHRYGVFPLCPEVRQALAARLRSAAVTLRREEAIPQSKLLEGLADWLDLRVSPEQDVSILGI
jgi:hypothetical protein